MKSFVMYGMKPRRSPFANGAKRDATAQALLFALVVAEVLQAFDIEVALTRGTDIFIVVIYLRQILPEVNLNGSQINSQLTILVSRYWLIVLCALHEPTLLQDPFRLRAGFYSHALLPILFLRTGRPVGLFR